jgi:drug/metabolite transporter (DMT)-like permease
MDLSAEFPATVQSLLLGSLALLAGAVAFACAGLLLRSGPSAQTMAFCQVFLLGAAATGFTFMLVSKVAPRRVSPRRTGTRTGP